MTWLAILVLVAFVAISLGWMRRVRVVFAGSGLLRLCGVVLFVASVFVALTAVFGGITLSLGIDKFPAQWLVGTPFGSYVIPGLILTVVVGGSATAATVAELRESSAGALFSIIGGVILLGWLVGERVILPKEAFLPQFFWLEAIYIGAGLLMVLPSLVVRWSIHKKAATVV
ncbi:MAG TPA: hypothetical protein VMT75_00790 [Candidatus Saccharimonadales bacterium]|nr:hypothetical protein [Candidatus Saccharimonadales bacterium]